MTTSRNQTICDNSDINATLYNAGVITNPNYPNWEPNKNCARKIVAGVGKIIRVYINDLNIEKPTGINAE